MGTNYLYRKDGEFHPVELREVEDSTVFHGPVIIKVGGLSHGNKLSLSKG
jgi:hypothetical protein